MEDHWGMTTRIKHLAIAITLLFVAAGAANAQSSAPASGSNGDDWKVNIYPVFAWLPLGMGLEVEVPDLPEGGGGGSAKIIDSRFDGAFLGGFSVAKGLFRVDADGLWAAVGGDRPERPFLRVDADVIYFHTTAGVKVARDFYLTGGVRRLALKYNVAFAEQPEFERKPGVWNPVVGIGWHRYGTKLETHTTFEGGGFGVGADIELAGTFRVDWKPVTHFGLTAGYSFLYFKVEDELRNRTFTVKQTLHGPILGIGLYF
jgi:hypothetical protein